MSSKRIVASLVFFFTFTAAHAQFANVLLSQKPRPIVTKSELEGDSTHYLDTPNNFKDRRGNVVHSVWTEFDKYKSSRRTDSSVIMYSRVEGAGKGWTPPTRISALAGDCSNG